MTVRAGVGRAISKDGLAVLSLTLTNPACFWHARRLA